LNPFYTDVARRAGHRCEYCHAPEGAFNFPFEVDHIVPSAASGPTETDNLALACRSCNAFKGSRVMGLDPESQAAISLFHPRHHAWEQHFAVKPETLEIVGQTPTGRATVVVLQMNVPAQLLARRQWKRLEMFP
jgi:5-methylcytosine-specific restriction endonuclease McrA